MSSNDDEELYGDWDKGKLVAVKGAGVVVKGQIVRGYVGVAMANMLLNSAVAWIIAYMQW